MKRDEEILDEIHYAKGHSKSAKKIYRNATKIYTNINQSSLQELIDEADLEEEDRIRWRDRKLKTRLIKYRQYLITHYKKNTVSAYFNAITSIYKYYEIQIGELPSINKKTLNLPKPVNYIDLPTKEIIRKALKIADNRMKTIILFQCSSGCAKKETLSLSIQHLIEGTSDYHKHTNIYDVIHDLKDRNDIIPMFQLKRQKTNKHYYTFCSPEAFSQIITYLQTREEPLTPETPLFPIHEDYLTLLFIQINNTLGLGKKGTYNRFRSHMLRKFHASQLYNNGMSLDEIDALQGRGKDATHSAYFLEDPVKLRERYIEHLGAVTIDWEVIDIKSPEYIRLEQENKAYKENLDELWAELDNIKNRQNIWDSMK